MVIYSYCGTAAICTSGGSVGSERGGGRDGGCRRAGVPLPAALLPWRGASAGARGSGFAASCGGTAVGTDRLPKMQQDRELFKYFVNAQITGGNNLFELF